MIHFDCRYFKTSKPCIFNKVDGSECPSCRHYSALSERILFIKLDAIGDVLRSACLLPAIIGLYKSPYVAWLTRPESAELVGMMPLVDQVIILSAEIVPVIMAGGWTQVISLSNDALSASLASLARGSRPTIGYFMKDGTPTPSNRAAEHWLEMAAFDRIKRQNEQTYQARMLAILRSPEQFSRPLLKVPQPSIDRATERVSSVCRGTRRLAINVGSGGRWPKKMLDAEKIGKLINVVMGLVDVDIILVGGAAEQSKTGFLIEPCGSTRVHPMLTPDSIGDFVAVLMQADLLLSGDTLALHIATAINLPTIAVFGPTSAAEIPDFDGLIDKVWTPQLDCLGCYGDCAKVANCMSLLDIDYLAQRIVARLTK